MMSTEAGEAQVLAAACALAGGNAQKARTWYEGEPLREFDGATVRELVAAGRAQDVLRLLDMCDAGAAG